MVDAQTRLGCWTGQSLRVTRDDMLVKTFATWEEPSVRAIETSFLCLIGLR